MGLTCYANAVIQTLRFIPRLKWLLEPGRADTLFQTDEGVKPRRLRQQELTTTFGEVVQMLWQCKRGQSVRPGEFWKRLRPAVDDTMYEHLANKAPHDSHEFFLFLLETIHEATAQEVDMRILRPPPQTADERLVHGALAAWQREFSKEYSPFVDLFFGLHHWQTECQACKNVSHRWESFNSLKVSMPAGGLAVEPPKLEDLLRGDMESEMIEDYQCDNCKGRTQARRWARIWRLPQVVVVVLKRFTPDGRKIHTRLADLGGPGLNFAPYFSEASPERRGEVEYALKGIVDHHGSAGGGHYTAQCLQDLTWYLYDDEGVIEMPGNKPSRPHVGDSTYMLFFERVVQPRAPAA
jgi:ubiquitin C-terminal hydrolase